MGFSEHLNREVHEILLRFVISVPVEPVHQLWVVIVDYCYWWKLSRLQRGLGLG